MNRLHLAPFTICKINFFDLKRGVVRSCAALEHRKSIVVNVENLLATRRYCLKFTTLLITSFQSRCARLTHKKVLPVLFCYCLSSSSSSVLSNCTLCTKLLLLIESLLSHIIFSQKETHACEKHTRIYLRIRYCEKRCNKRRLFFFVYFSFV